MYLRLSSHVKYSNLNSQLDGSLSVRSRLYIYVSRALMIQLKNLDPALSKNLSISHETSFRWQLLLIQATELSPVLGNNVAMSTITTLRITREMKHFAWQNCARRANFRITLLSNIAIPDRKTVLIIKQRKRDARENVTIRWFAFDCTTRTKPMR